MLPNVVSCQPFDYELWYSKNTRTAVSNTINAKPIIAIICGVFTAKHLLHMITAAISYPIHSIARNTKPKSLNHVPITPSFRIFGNKSVIARQTGKLSNVAAAMI